MSSQPTRRQYAAAEHCVSNCALTRFTEPTPCARRSVSARFPEAESVFDAIVPPKGELRIVKVAAPSRTSIYLSEVGLRGSREATCGCAAADR